MSMPILRERAEAYTNSNLSFQLIFLGIREKIHRMCPWFNGIAYSSVQEVKKYGIWMIKYICCSNSLGDLLALVSCTFITSHW